MGPLRQVLLAFGGQMASGLFSGSSPLSIDSIRDGASAVVPARMIREIPHRKDRVTNPMTVRSIGASTVRPDPPLRPTERGGSEVPRDARAAHLRDA